MGLATEPRSNLRKRLAAEFHDPRRHPGHAAHPQLHRRVAGRRLNHTLSRVSRSRTVRLISNANHKPPVLLALAQSHGALEKLEALGTARSIRRPRCRK